MAIGFILAIWLVSIVLVSWLWEAQWVVKLAADLGIRRAVVIRDFQGEERFQFLRRDWKGRLWCRSMGSIGQVFLEAGGGVPQPHYVTSWEPYKWAESEVPSAGPTKAA